MQEGKVGHHRITFHAYKIMYSLDIVDIVGLPRQCADQFYTLIQEIKRNMVFRRCSRLVNNKVGGIDQRRVGCHLTINVQYSLGKKEKLYIHLDIPHRVNV